MLRPCGPSRRSPPRCRHRGHPEYRGQCAHTRLCHGKAQCYPARRRPACCRPTRRCPARAFTLPVGYGVVCSCGPSRCSPPSCRDPEYRGQCAHTLLCRGKAQRYPACRCPACCRPARRCPARVTGRTRRHGCLCARLYPRHLLAPRGLPLPSPLPPLVPCPCPPSPLLGPHLVLRAPSPCHPSILPHSRAPRVPWPAITLPYSA